MSIPKFKELMLPLLKVLGDGKERSLRDCIEALAGGFQLSEERARLLKSGQPVFDSRVRWARLYLKHARLLESPRRGVVRITSRGKSCNKSLKGSTMIS